MSDMMGSLRGGNGLRFDGLCQTHTVEPRSPPLVFLLEDIITSQRLLKVYEDMKVSSFQSLTTTLNLSMGHIF
jgi:hypothetical protein